MVIGILGNKGVGKSTLGKMIWGLIQGYSDSAIINSILLGTPLEVLKEQQNFKIKKFADTLKDMLCVFLDCTREDLEIEEFKNKSLGYLIYKIQMNYVDKKGVNREIIFNEVYYSINDAEANLKEHQKRNYNAVLSNTNPVYKIVTIDVTPRYLMESLGTDWGRVLINPNVWVSRMYKDYQQSTKSFLVKNIPIESGAYVGEYEIPAFYPNSGEIRETEYSTEEIKTYPFWIIDDVRMENEVHTLTSKRDSTLIYLYNEESEKPITSSTPESEKTKMYATYANYSINNTGTLNDLLIKAKAILKRVFERMPWIDITHLTNPVREEVVEASAEVPEESFANNSSDVANF